MVSEEWLAMCGSGVATRTIATSISQRKQVYPMPGTQKRVPSRANGEEAGWAPRRTSAASMTVPSDTSALCNVRCVAPPRLSHEGCASASVCRPSLTSTRYLLRLGPMIRRFVLPWAELISEASIHELGRRVLKACQTSGNRNSSGGGGSSRGSSSCCCCRRGGGGDKGQTCTTAQLAFSSIAVFCDRLARSSYRRGRHPEARGLP